MNARDDGLVIDEGMRDYYERRAGQYDDWWLGSGRFASRDRPGWGQEVEALTGLLEGLSPVRVLDVACGTGFLTRHLRGTVTAIDQSAAMARIAASRLAGARVLVAEAVPLDFAAGEFERVITSHFYGHLLEQERARFLAEARRVGGELVIVDSARAAGPGEQWETRVLNDGSEHRVYKRWFDGAQLVRELGGGEVLMDGSWFAVAARRWP